MTMMVLEALEAGEKYYRLKCDDVGSVEECSLVTAYMDKVIANIEFQLSAEKDLDWEDRDHAWKRSAQLAKKSAAIFRTRVQDIRGDRRREENARSREENARSAERRNVSQERLFIQAAMMLLTGERVQAIWDEVNASQAQGDQS